MIAKKVKIEKLLNISSFDRVHLEKQMVLIEKYFSINELLMI